MGCHFVLQEVFPTQGWNPRLLPLLPWQPVDQGWNPRLLPLLPWQPGSLSLVPAGSRDADCGVLWTLKPSHPFEKDQSAGWDERVRLPSGKTNEGKATPTPPPAKPKVPNLQAYL